MLATASIVRALRAAHLHDASRAELLRLACEKIRGLGAPYTSVYAYMLHGDELVLEAFSGRETEHTRIPVGHGVWGPRSRPARTRTSTMWVWWAITSPAISKPSRSWSS